MRVGASAACRKRGRLSFLIFGSIGSLQHVDDPLPDSETGCKNYFRERLKSQKLSIKSIYYRTNDANRQTLAEVNSIAPVARLYAGDRHRSPLWRRPLPGAPSRADAPAVLDQLPRELIRLLGIHFGLCPSPSGGSRARSTPFANDLAQAGPRRRGQRSVPSPRSVRAGSRRDARRWMGMRDIFSFLVVRLIGRGVQLHVPSVTLPPDEA